ncbi:unnamed protein product, partial [Brassica oleracea var. botrytis]
MWGKGKRLEIHNNPLNRLVIVRISSDYLRKKILEKCIWHVGDSMFHTVQWCSAHSMSTPPLKAIQIWAHLTGEPKETDDFTKNLVSLTVAHVKVEVDLTKPLPPVVEFERQSGEVVEVLVHYPWVPPTCSHCKELGHIVRNCLTYPPPDQNTEKKQDQQTRKQRGKLQARYQPKQNNPSTTPALTIPPSPTPSPLPTKTPTLPIKTLIPP